MKRPLFVFIGGGSASGKTTFTGKLKKALEALGEAPAVVAMDNYYYDKPEHLSVSDYINGHNLDTPEAINFQLLAEQLLQLNEGSETLIPKYCFKQSKCVGTYAQKGTQIILVEGIFALEFVQRFFKESDALVRLSVNISVESYLTLKAMRAKRNEALFGQTKEEVESNDRTKVGPGFFGHTAAYARYADVDIVNKYCVELMEADALELAHKIVATKELQHTEFRNVPMTQEIVAASCVDYKSAAEISALAAHSLFPEPDEARFPVNKKLEPTSEFVL